MTTNILHDNRFTFRTCSLLWALFLHHFEYDKECKSVADRKFLEPRRSKLGKAKKEIEAIGGYLSFVPRGNRHIEILYKIPK